MISDVVRVKVKFISIVRERTGKSEVEFISSGRKFGDVLKEIIDEYHIGDIILKESGEVRPWARVLVNGRSHEFIGGLDVELHDGDRVALIYPYTENF